MVGMGTKAEGKLDSWTGLVATKPEQTSATILIQVPIQSVKSNITGTGEWNNQSGENWKYRHNWPEILWNSVQRRARDSSLWRTFMVELSHTWTINQLKSIKYISNYICVYYICRYIIYVISRVKTGLETKYTREGRVWVGWVIEVNKIEG